MADGEHHDHHDPRQPGGTGAGRGQPGVLLRVDGPGRRQQRQVHLLGGDLHERAAGQQVPQRVLGLGLLPRNRCRRAGRSRPRPGWRAVGGRTPPWRRPSGCSGRWRPGRCRPRTAGGPASGSFGPARNAVVAVTSASDSDRYICWALRLSGSLVETTSWAADACWITVHAPTAPQARQARSRPTMSRRSRVGVVDTDRRRAIRPGWPGRRDAAGGAARGDGEAGDGVRSAITPLPSRSAGRLLAGPGRPSGRLGGCRRPG